MNTAPTVILALGATFALSFALPFSAAHATNLASPAAKQLYTCERGGLSRVAYAVQPASCCTGMLGCPQLLANTGLVKPRRGNRT